MREDRREAISVDCGDESSCKIKCKALRDVGRWVIWVHNCIKPELHNRKSMNPLRVS